MGQPAAVLDHAVELVAVQHQQALSLGGDVHVLVQDFDVAEGVSGELAREFVMVARDEYDPGALRALRRMRWMTSLCARGQCQCLRSCQPSTMSPTR